MTETDTKKPEQSSETAKNPQENTILSALDSQLIDLLPVAAFICAAPSGRLVRQNACATALWPESEGNSRQFFEALQSCSKPDAASSHKLIAETLHSGAAVRDQAALLTVPGGRALPVRATIKPIDAPGGKISGALVMLWERQETPPKPDHQQLLAELPVAAYTCDDQGMLTAFNDAAAELWARRPALNDPTERFCGSANLLSPTGQPLALAQSPVALALKSNSDCLGHEVVIERPDGTRHGALAYVSPLGNAEDNTLGCLTLLIELNAYNAHSSPTRKMLSDLDIEHTQLLEVFDRTPVFMAVLRGPDHVFERANERYRRLIGKRAFIGKPVRDALPEIIDQGYIEILDRVYHTCEPFIGTNMTISLTSAPDEAPQERILEFVYEPLPAANGLEAGVLALGIDLTERKKTEAELAVLTSESARASRLYETILGATPDLVYVFDLEHRFIYANHALLTMWGRSWQESIGKTCLELGYPDWHAAMHNREIDQVVATKHALRGQVPFSGTLGERIYEYIFVPVLAENGEVEAVAGTTRDITEHKHMEDELHYRAQQLAKADQKKDEFIAMLAHELRNPLAPLRNGLQLLQRGGVDEQTQTQIHAMMDRQMQHMVRLIDDLLDISRLNRNKLSLQKTPIAINEVISDALETMRPSITAAGHQLEVSLPKQPITVNADLTRLAQVVGNLLSNSIKYTPPGGRIVLSVEPQDQEVEIIIEDTGIGIPAEALPHLFDMFTQAHHDSEQSTGGLGIGLALVKTLVEMHGGSVSARSAGLHRGSTFSVRLPVLSEGRDAAAPETRAPRHSSQFPGSRRVLIVDDNRDACKSMAMLFQMLGNEVHQAYDGLEAITAVLDFRPDLILMDVGMPKLNGYDAVRRIRIQPEGQHITIIAVTGWGQDKDRSESKAAGFDGHLVKPVSLADLEQLLNLQDPV